MRPDNPEAMTCEQARELAGDRTVHEDSQFCEHLAACADCRAFDEQLRAQHAILDGWAAPDPGGDMTARVMAGIARAERDLRETESRHGAPARIARLFTVPSVRLPVAAAFALGLLLLASLGINGVLLASRRAPSDGESAKPAQTVAVIDGKLLESIAPVLTPGALTSQQSGLTAVRPFHSGAGPIPMGVIVILGVPPPASAEAFNDI